MAAILDCILPPFALSRRCLLDPNILFKVSTARKMQLKVGSRAVCVPRDSAYVKKIITVIQSILAAILDFGHSGMCYGKMIVRNEFVMLKFE